MPVCARPVQLIALLVLSVLVSACRQPEDPARVEIRARLKQNAVLSDEELGRVVEMVGRAVAGKAVRFNQDAGTGELNQEQREVVLGMLTNRMGMYDEGLQVDRGATVRVLNAPGVSLHAEYSASRRLLVDVETLLPRRFEFSYEFAGMGDYALDLLIDP
jgi:hypothetical protein